MRNLLVTLVILLLLAAGNFAQSHPKAERTMRCAEISKEAKASWPKFLASFRAALKKRDRKMLDSLVSEKYERNCSGENERAELLEGDGQYFDLFLDIVTPGRSKHHESIIRPFKCDMSYDPGNEKEAIYSRDAEMACWSLTFVFRKKTGWQIVYHGLQCEGC